MQTYQVWVGAGFTTHDITVRPPTNGGSVSARFNIGVHREHRGRDETFFMACLAFGETAELLSHVAKAGSLVLVQGRLKLEDMVSEDTGTVNQQLLCIVSQAVMLKTASQPKTDQVNNSDLDDITPGDDGDLGPQVQVNVHPKDETPPTPTPSRPTANRRYRTNF